MYDTFLAGPKHYRPLAFDTTWVLDFYLALTKQWAPPRFSKGKQWSYGVIAYAYETYKRKCWLHGHNCSKAHNCCRELVSWVHWPYASLLRKVGRAWQVIVETISNPHFELWNMAKVTAIVENRVNDCCVMPEYICSCMKCGNGRYPIEFLVGDVAARFMRNRQPRRSPAQEGQHVFALRINGERKSIPEEGWTTARGRTR